MFVPLEIGDFLFIHFIYLFFYFIFRYFMPTDDCRHCRCCLFGIGPLQRIVNKFLELWASHRHGKVDVRNRIHLYTHTHTLFAGERSNNNDRPTDVCARLCLCNGECVRMCVWNVHWNFCLSVNRLLWKIRNDDVMSDVFRDRLYFSFSLSVSTFLYSHFRCASGYVC